MSRKPYLIPDRILKEMVEAVIVQAGFITSFHLFKAIVNFHHGNIKILEKSLMKVMLSKFDFLSEKY